MSSRKRSGSGGANSASAGDTNAGMAAQQTAAASAPVSAGGATSVVPSSSSGGASPPAQGMVAGAVAAARNRASGGASLREKVAQMYDVLLRGDEPSKSSFGESFWAEFFLLRPKIALLEAEVGKALIAAAASPAESALLASASPAHAGIKRNLNLLFGECLANLGEEHHIRVVYALQTLCGLMRAITRRQSTGFDLVNLLVGFDEAEARMQKLIGHLNE